MKPQISKRGPVLDLVAIGDATLDVFLQIHDATLSCQLNKTACLLCFEYADKIPVTNVTKVPGSGNASNAAVGGSRLGLRSGIVSILGHDDVGEEILRHWQREHVANNYITIDEKRGTNYSTVLRFKGERTILTYSQHRTYMLPKNFRGAPWIYYTALGAKHESMERQLLVHLKKNPKQRLAFNPGTSQLHRGLAALKSVIKRSEVFIVNKEEAMRLLEDGTRPIQNSMLMFHKIGARIVVITDGPNGSYASDGKKVWFCPIFPGPIVERTGAGDAYTTAFVYALTQGWPVAEAMRYGSANAWSVVQKIGPQAGLLHINQMSAALKKFKKIQPKIHSQLFA